MIFSLTGGGWPGRQIRDVYDDVTYVYDDVTYVFSLTGGGWPGRQIREEHAADDFANIHKTRYSFQPVHTLAT